MTWQEITFSIHPENAARGRNGWFVPRRAYVSALADSLRCEVFSCRDGDMPPIVLQLSRSDATALADAIRNVVTGQGRS